MKYIKKDYPREMRSYSAAKSRCQNKNNDGYALYGGRGIEFRFKSFDEFLDHMGTRPDQTPGKYSLDRIDNSGHYEVGNCRWATRKEQARNTRTNRHFTINGQTKNLSEWCEIYNITPKIASYRICSGWDVIEALETPVGYRHGKRGKFNEPLIHYNTRAKKFLLQKRKKGQKPIVHRFKTLEEAKEKRMELYGI